MSVRILTDSVADLPLGIARGLGIEVVPLLVRFGDEEYRDGVDITTEQFYRMLQERREFPATATPSPATFAEAYDRLAADTFLTAPIWHVAGRGEVCSALLAGR